MVDMAHLVRVVCADPTMQHVCASLYPQVRAGISTDGNSVDLDMAKWVWGGETLPVYLAHPGRLERLVTALLRFRIFRIKGPQGETAADIIAKYGTPAVVPSLWFHRGLALRCLAEIVICLPHIDSSLLWKRFFDSLRHWQWEGLPEPSVNVLRQRAPTNEVAAAILKMLPFINERGQNIGHYYRNEVGFEAGWVPMLDMDESGHKGGWQGDGLADLDFEDPAAQPSKPVAAAAVAAVLLTGGVYMLARRRRRKAKA